jgi:hypothetical protein
VLFGVMGPLLQVGTPIPGLSDGPANPALVGHAPSAPDWVQACSVRHDVCVHAPPGTAASGVLAALGATDEAWDALTGPLRLPAPGPDADGRWHLYMVDDEPPRAAEPLARDAVARFDRTSSFGLVTRLLGGCSQHLAVARAIARGALWRAAPATDEGSAVAESETVARLATPCAAPEEYEDAAVFQDEPERTIVAVQPPGPGAFNRGASLFFEWLDRRFGTQPGSIVEGLWALAPTQTPARAGRWAASPTGFDVLRVSLAGVLGTDSDLDDVLLQFAIERATTSPPSRLAWHVPWPAQARRFASPEPVAPTGASYVWIDHAGAPAGATLQLEATWEDYARMRWAVVKVDSAGRAMAVVPISTQRLATSAAITIESLDGVDHLIVVGADVGSTEHPFDPDQGWWEPHGWLLTIQAR